ncbi:hypothetical protein CEXT_330831 [Caerostris extrusa]|uniref:Uncharacterized protein n=1 Tax=Caerostris extrusa TaxID=172846 RepID=A0AAV4WUY9_CAEEX|nr:hypothetical protein CEXT_330831 [Caerostris extrusa]
MFTVRTLTFVQWKGLKLGEIHFKQENRTHRCVCAMVVATTRLRLGDIHFEYLESNDSFRLCVDQENSSTMGQIKVRRDPFKVVHGGLDTITLCVQSTFLATAKVRGYPFRLAGTEILAASTRSRKSGVDEVRSGGRAPPTHLAALFRVGRVTFDRFFLPRSAADRICRSRPDGTDTLKGPPTRTRVSPPGIFTAGRHEHHRPYMFHQDGVL